MSTTSKLDKEAEEIAQISNVQLINILFALKKRVETLENVLLESDEFLTTEVLKARLDLVSKDNKTPYKRLLELEQKVDGIWESFEGFVSSYYQDKKKPMKAKLGKTYKGIQIETSN